jgi:hypothetical protein
MARKIKIKITEGDEDENDRTAIKMNARSNTRESAGWQKLLRRKRNSKKFGRYV